ncbi:MAG: hypothetical protein C5B47_06320 [Verrucomicrobia bacterium]|nr:MAG: hypothetical protein C5B47_06320 [Verrucomicrobiota bacterium]
MSRDSCKLNRFRTTIPLKNQMNPVAAENKVFASHKLFGEFTAVRPRHYILVPLGTTGDVNPFLWMGHLLRNRGHEVTLILATAFEPPPETHNFQCFALKNQKELQAVLDNPRLWHPWHGVRILFSFAGAHTEQIFRLIYSSRRLDMDNVILAPGTAFGARLAREKLGFPLGTIHLQPCAIPSAYEPPAMRRGFRWMSKLYWVWRRFFSFIPTPLDFYAGPGIRRACRSQRILPPNNVLNQWWHSPDGVLCLFPSWLARPQPDWPTRWAQSGFPLYDRHAEILADDLQKFLVSGPPPVVFTLGTAMKHPKNFFEIAVRVCSLLGYRGLFFSSIPMLPPPHVFLCRHYVPFSWLFPKVKAVVHHGGIGTLSQALAAGIPQLLMPLGFDQPDNAARLAKLGVARIHCHFTVESIARELRALLTDPSIHTACKTVASRFSSKEDAVTTLTFLENLTYSTNTAH